MNNLVSRESAELEAPDLWSEYRPHGIQGTYLNVSSTTGAFGVTCRSSGRFLRFEYPFSWGPPKVGLVLMHSLSPEDVCGKDVCELGGGYYAFNAGASVLLGARSAVSVEPYGPAVNWARQQYCQNELHNIRNLYGHDLEVVGDSRFDLIVGALPMLPTPSSYPWDLRDTLYHFAGDDGWAVMQGYIESAPRYLHPGGEIRLLVAEFMGVEKPYGDLPTAFERLEAVGMSAAVLSGISCPLSEEHLLNTDEAYRRQFAEIYPDYEIGSSMGFSVVEGKLR